MDYSVKVVMMILLVIFIAFSISGMRYRIKCDNNGWKFEQTFPERLLMLAIVSIILCVITLIPIGLVNFGNWLISVGYAEISPSSIEFFVFIGHLLLLGLGFILIIISALMVLFYTIIELYAIWYYLVKPKIVLGEKQNKEVREVKEDNDGWKEV